MAAFTTADTGKGVWWVIHITAYTQTPGFPEMVHSIANNFFCDKCGSHFRSHLTTNPIPRDPSRWFVWTVDLHNKVNEVLYRQGDRSKRVIGLSEAIEMIRPLRERPDYDPNQPVQRECAGCPHNSQYTPMTQPRPSVPTFARNNYHFFNQR